MDMDNRVSEIRKKIRALRVTMLKAEALMRDQINRDEECSVAARQILAMRAEMSQLVKERERLGDREPISIDHFFSPRRLPAQKPVVVRPVKRCLM